MMMFGGILISVGLAVSVSALPTRRQAQNGTTYGRLIVFGDSLSDNGSGAWIVSNMTWPADPAYYNHSFTNGPVWADTLAETLGAQLIDYATGGATADNSFVAGFTGPTSNIPVPSAYDQIQKFFSTDQAREDDLFVHWIGANDILFNPFIQGSQVVSLINRDIDLLWRSGAKNVVMVNLPPLNAIPAGFGNPLIDQLGTPFAAAITRGLTNIIGPYSPWLQIGFVDVQSLLNTVLADPEAYGFDPRYLNPPTPCLKGTYGTGSRSLCDDPARHLWWDNYHPTAGAHNLIAQEFEKVLTMLQ